MMKQLVAYYLPFLHFIVGTFLEENYDEILPVLYTWKGLRLIDACGLEKDYALNLYGHY